MVTPDYDPDNAPAWLWLAVAAALLGLVWLASVVLG